MSRLDFVMCDMLKVVEDAVEKYNIPRDYLHIEVTESMIVQDEDLMIDIISKFRARGYEIWMDDFGSGYSSLSLLKDWGPEVSENYSTYNIGYSLGGAVSLGIARRVELDPEIREIMHLKHSYCGAGPYDQGAMMDLFLSQPDEVLDLAVSIPFAIKSMLFTSPSLSAKYNESDFFSQGLHESGILEKMDTRNYETDNLNSMMYNSGYNTPNTIMSAGLLQDGTPLAIAFRQELDKLNLTVGWTPTIPISLYHSKEDKIVPIVCLDSLKAKMGDNTNITIQVFETGNHQDTGTEFYKAVLL